MALYSLEPLKDKICRVYSNSREDIFNVKIHELPEWSIIHKMLFNRREMSSFTTAMSIFTQHLLRDGDRVSDENFTLAVKFHVESYFSNTNYRKDEHMKKLEGAGGWIPLKDIYKFRKTKRFHERLTLRGLYEIMKLSSDVEVKEEIIRWSANEQELTYFIRKKKQSLNSDYVNFFGFSVETIK